MHRAGLVHQDLYAKHIFVRREGGGFVINVIDLQRMRRSRGTRLAVKDLAALNVTMPADLAGLKTRMRFLKEYVRTNDGAPGVRALFRRVLRRSRHIAGRSKFRGIDWSRRSAGSEPE